jgi:hypothetical protein
MADRWVEPDLMIGRISFSFEAGNFDIRKTAWICSAALEKVEKKAAVI